MLKKTNTEKQTFKVGVYVSLAILTISSILYFLGIIIKDNKEPSALSCFAIQSIFNDLEENMKLLTKKGYPSTKAKIHNEKLDTALKAAKQGGCYTQNLPKINNYLRLSE